MSRYKPTATRVARKWLASQEGDRRLLKMNRNRGLTARAALKSKREYVQAFRQAKGIIEGAIRRHDWETGIEAYRSLAKILHPLSKALDGVTLHRKEEQRKLKNVIRNLRWMGRLTSPDRLSTAAKDIGLNAPDSSVLLIQWESLAEVVPSILRVFTRITGYQNIERTFQHGNYTVHNSMGYRPDEYANALATLDAASAAVTKAGFGNLIYGDVNLVGASSMQRGWEYCGRYQPKSDSIRVNAECNHRFDEVYTMVHELGHRYWFKRMAQGQQDDYEDAYQGTSSAPLTLENREDMWQAFKRAGYTLRGVASYLKDPGLLEPLRRLVRENRRDGMVIKPDPIRIQQVTGITEELASRAILMRHTRLYAFDDDPPESVSSYGETNVLEDFAEVFAHHVLGKSMPTSARQRFDKARDI